MAEASMDDAPESAASLGSRERQILVLDLSKSMLAPLPDPTGSGGAQPKKIEVARTAVYRILENAVSARASFGLVTFTEVARVAVPLTEMRRENLPSIESLLSMLQPSGRSAIWDALALAADLLRSLHGGVRGQILLVTDGWDNASTRFTVSDPNQKPARDPRMSLVEYMLPPNSDVSLKVIGIGDGAERDKGVDSAAMGFLLTQLNFRARGLAVPSNFSYQEVVTGAQLFNQMVHAFLDVGFEGSRPLEELHPEELARHAANAARALKDPEQHATIGRLSVPKDAPAAPAHSSEALEVDVVDAPGGSMPPYLKDRYGPLGGVIESYLAHEYDQALARLRASASVIPPVTRLYWEARIDFAKGLIVEAARALLQAWTEAEKLPRASRGRVVRRLALLQARLQNDNETETLVRLVDETQSRLSKGDPKLRDRLDELFDGLMNLRATYQLTRVDRNPAERDLGGGVA
ncbi:MAG: VWA domain-containing protein, partial [Thermoplasmata archaeon]|nr:VWA domain-containing protein [Thermoplasmata archaeon]